MFSTGIPDAGFSSGLILGDLSGKNQVEDIHTMTEENPLWNSYWESRRAVLENIQVPLYVVASWTNPLHARGTLKAFEKSGSKYKWLRIHNSHEWPGKLTIMHVSQYEAG
jgi:predicted acyl esterase